MPIVSSSQVRVTPFREWTRRSPIPTASRSTSPTTPRASAPRASIRAATRSTTATTRLGRLSELTDGSGNLIVQYTYNNLGQLAKKLNGNGTYTTYAYDAAGNLTSEINYAAGGTTVNSSFTYTYNVLDEMTSHDRRRRQRHDATATTPPAS